MTMLTSTPATSSERTSAAALGLTLIELALVLFILGLLVAITVPKLRSVEGVELAASASRLETLVRYLGEEAAFRGTVLRLNYDLNGQSFSVTTLDDSLEEPEFVADEASLASPVHLPDSVTIVDVALASAEKITEGRVFTQFYPQGYADYTIVHLRGRSGEYATVAIESLTGKATVHEGYLEALDIVGETRGGV